MVEMGNVAEFVRGPFGSSIKRSVCVPKGIDTYKVYEQGNIIKNDFNRGEYYVTREQFEKLSRFEFSVMPFDEFHHRLPCVDYRPKPTKVSNRFLKNIITLNERCLYTICCP